MSVAGQCEDDVVREHRLTAGEYHVGKSGSSLGSTIEIGDLPSGCYRYDDSKTEAMKVKSNAKTGVISGSFKLYAVNSNGKVKKITAKVSGVLIGDVGYCQVTVKVNGKTEYISATIRP